MNLNIYAESATGSVRSENQDRTAALRLGDNAVFAVVCDGMGGENAGSFASQKAIDIVSDRIRNGYRPDISEKGIKNLLVGAVRTANAVVFDISENDVRKRGMGTTCVAALRRDNRVFCINVGDSRGYLITDGKISQITKDHSLVMQLFEKGQITKEQMKTHPQRNYLTRAVGVTENVSPDYFELDISDGDMILLCSDGLCGVCHDEDILNAVKNSAEDNIPAVLIRLAADCGSRDNITAAVIV